MKIIWQLFSVHIIVITIILILLIAWLVWPRKFKTTRKALLATNGFVLLCGLAMAMYTYWPRQYQKLYLNAPISAEIKSTPLRALADSIDFNIGVAISPGSNFKELIVTEFNSVVAENHFKPGYLMKDPGSWEFDFSSADELIAFSRSNGLRIRGHTLIWGKFPGMTYPKEWISQINEASDKEQKMKALMTQYIETVMGHFKGQVPTWDVVNEPMGGEQLYPSIFTQSMGEEYIDLAFQLARETDPSCTLFLNEQISYYDSPQAKAFLKLLERLINRKVPIDGVGLQTHHINQIHQLEGLKGYIREIGALGLTVEITELDIRLLLFDDEEDPYKAQGQQFKEIVSICLNDPACNGVTFWGLTDGANWMDAVPPFKWKSPNCPNLFDEDMVKKPAYVGVWEALRAVQ
ncbi:MAG: endo-1,4-beta-xylanase [Saprospiraceae bacterium]|nr:endo-1,4-beta-xylanase [Saprospiraceae bacterium]